MYKIKRNNHIFEQLEIDDNGQKIVVDADINVDGILKQYTELGSSLGKLKQRYEATNLQGGDVSDIYEALGRTIVQYFELFFGEEQTAKLIQFYEGRYVEMLRDITPFVVDVIEPRIVEARDALRKQYKTIARGRA